jgi:hypothetical protein
MDEETRSNLYAGWKKAVNATMAALCRAAFSP